MANPDYLYFDFPYEVNPEERGYYWGARFNSVYKVFTFAPENLAQNAETSTDRDGNNMSVTTPDVPMPKIRGMQGQTWSETVRTDEQYFEMAFPRVLAVAERAIGTVHPGSLIGLLELRMISSLIWSLKTNLKRIMMSLLQHSDAGKS